MNYDELSEKAIAAGENGGMDAIFDYIGGFISKNPNSSDAYRVRSELYTEMGDFQKAFADAEKAITSKPSDANLYNNRGCIYVRAGDDIKKALKDFDKAIELNPNSASAYTNRANVYLKMHEAQKAIDDLNSRCPRKMRRFEVKEHGKRANMVRCGVPGVKAEVTMVPCKAR